MKVYRIKNEHGLYVTFDESGTWEWIDDRALSFFTYAIEEARALVRLLGFVEVFLGRSKGVRLVKTPLNE